MSTTPVNLVITAILYIVTRWSLTMGTFGKLVSIPLSFAFLAMVIVTILHFTASIGSGKRERQTRQDELDHKIWWDALPPGEQRAHNAEAKRLSEIVPETTRVPELARR